MGRRNELIARSVGAIKEARSTDEKAELSRSLRRQTESILRLYGQDKNPKSSPDRLARYIQDAVVLEGVPVPYILEANDVHVEEADSVNIQIPVLMETLQINRDGKNRILPKGMLYGGDSASLDQLHDYREIVTEIARQKAHKASLRSKS
jgi:hypothetical protein